MSAPGVGALRVISSGLCCSVGYTADAASCALRAGMDHFQESDFVADGSERLRVARLPSATLWGGERLALWVRQAVADCLGGVKAFETADTALCLLTLERERPHGDDRTQFATAQAAQRVLGHTFSADSRVFTAGRAGLGHALLRIRHLIDQGHVRRVLLVGVDSYLNAATINHYLAQERLLTTMNRDGFLPGEAAAAVLLEAAAPDAPGFVIRGVGRDRADGRPDGSTPSRGRALTRAMRAALAAAQLKPDDLDFRLSDQNGESFFAREAANALTRLGVAPPTLTTADCVGEVGAATGPLMLAWLQRLMPRKDGPGARGLIHLANDDGERSAIVVSYQPVTA